MENEKPPTDIRIHIIVVLFFLCIAGGGAFLALYVLLPDSPSWYAAAGMVLVGIPWLVWLFTYIYSCIKIYRNARVMENNAGRVFPKATMSQRTRSTAMTERSTSRDAGQSPRSPAARNENNLHVNFRDDVLFEENSSQEQDGGSDSHDNDDGKKDENRKGRESEIPLTSSSSTS